jgi:hypothetical protein
MLFVIVKDSVLDLVTSLGVSSDRVVAAVPTFALQFHLRDAKQNLPGSQIAQGPTQISMEQVKMHFLSFSGFSS